MVSQQHLAESDSGRVLSVSMGVVVIPTAKHTTSVVHDHVKERSHGADTLKCM